MSPDAEGSNPGPARGMVVGIDGSPGSATALAWAADRVDRHGLIQPVAAWRFPWWATSGPVPLAGIPAYEDLEAMATAEADRLIETVPRQLRKPTVITEAAPGPTLVAYGDDAELIVVGTRGRGALADALLGSVSCYVVNHATVPVAVVPDGVDVSAPDAELVVGVDGSPNSVRALVWALTNGCPGDTVTAVHTWSFPVSAGPTIPVPPVDQLEAAARSTLDRAIAEAEAMAGDHGCHLERLIVQGDARRVLAEQARSGGVLVIGARGHGALAHILLGSVATSLVHQPVTTTIVVPGNTHSSTDEVEDRAPAQDRV